MDRASDKMKKKVYTIKNINNELNNDILETISKINEKYMILIMKH